MSKQVESGAHSTHPVSGKKQTADHGSAYPGVSPHPVSQVAEVVPVNPAALEEGMKNSMGDSASGTHKGLPSSKHPAHEPRPANPKGHAYHEKTGDAAREEGLSKEGFRCVKK